MSAYKLVVVGWLEREDFHLIQLLVSKISWLWGEDARDFLWDLAKVL